MALTYYKLLNSEEEFIDKVFALNKKFLPYIRQEYAAATKIQAFWKRYRVVKLIQKWHHAATVIQCIVRGYLARMKVRRIRIWREEESFRGFFHKSARTIQAAWRGYQYRKTGVDYYRRQNYLRQITELNEKIQRDSQEQRLRHTEEKLAKENAEKQAIAEKFLDKIHCQVSTKSVPGVHAKNARIEQAIIEQTKKRLNYPTKGLAAKGCPIPKKTIPSC